MSELSQEQAKTPDVSPEQSVMGSSQIVARSSFFNSIYPKANL